MKKMTISATTMRITISAITGESVLGSAIAVTELRD